MTGTTDQEFMVSIRILIKTPGYALINIEASAIAAGR
jgi:hypothetical protein